MKHVQFSVCLGIALFTCVASAQPPVCGGNSCGPNCTIVTHTDQTTGKTIWRFKKDDSHDHFLYVYREPWNADSTRMVGIQTSYYETDWKVVMFDQNGCFVKELFPISLYDWKLAWDKTDPNILYTTYSYTVYKINVNTDPITVTTLKTFTEAEGWTESSGVSVNRYGTRLLVVTSDPASEYKKVNVRTFALPSMTTPRVFQVDKVDPAVAYCNVDVGKIRYTGHLNDINTHCGRGIISDCGCGKTGCACGPLGLAYAIRTFDDTGTPLRTYGTSGDVPTFGHTAYSPNGHLGYEKYQNGVTGALEIRVCNTLTAANCGSLPFGQDSTDDKIVFTATSVQMSEVQTLHLHWPSAQVYDPMWLIASFSPRKAAVEGVTDPTWLHDEIYKITHTGAGSPTTTLLAHSRTVDEPGGQPSFWMQANANSNKDGTKINFNSDRRWDEVNPPYTPVATTDLHILYP